MTLAELHSRVEEALDLLLGLAGNLPEGITDSTAFQLGQVTAMLAVIKDDLEKQDQDHRHAP